MSIELKSNRKWIIKICIPFLAAVSLLAIIFLVALVLDYQTMRDSVGVLISFVIEIIVIVAIMHFVKYKKGPKFTFTESEIFVYDKKGNLQEEIQIADIDRMLYIKFKWQYLITMFVGALMEGGVYKIHVYEKNGDKHELGFIDVKDAKRLIELYQTLLTLRL